MFRPGFGFLPLIRRSERLIPWYHYLVPTVLTVLTFSIIYFLYSSGGRHRA